jgi:hypothetical protein
MIALAATLAACGGGGGSTTETPSGTGRLQVLLTDSQGCAYEAVEVTIVGVRVLPAGASDDDSQWVDLPLPGLPVKVDLLELRNGEALDLGALGLPAGDYQQVRLVLAGNGNVSPYANQLTLTPGAQPVPLKTPSAQQSGLKVKVDFTITAQQPQPTVLTLDFDPCKSVVKAGNSGQYLLKPVLYAFVDTASNIAGYTLPGALVSAQQGGVSMKSTTADASGRFVLWPVGAGFYDVVITKVDYTNAVLAGVEVKDRQATEVSTAVTPLTPSASVPPDAPFRSVTGTVAVSSAGSNLIDAGVRALQTVGTYQGPVANPLLVGAPLKIEVASTRADADLGTYGLSLPTASPERAFWQPGVTAYSFTPVDDTAGLYDIEARAEGFAAQTTPATLTSGDDVVDFTFPAP